MPGLSMKAVKSGHMPGTTMSTALLQTSLSPWTAILLGAPYLGHPSPALTRTQSAMGLQRLAVHYTSVQCLLRMPQTKVALSTAQSTAKAQGKSWGM